MSHKSFAKKKSLAERGLPSFGEYLEKRNHYDSFPARIEKGEMFILYEGEWIRRGEFDKIVTKPIMPDFRSSLENQDGTKKWMYL